MTVKQRQNLLAYLGYYAGAADGDWGSISRAACTAFQQDRGITVDGFGGPETDHALRDAVAKDLMKPEKTETFWEHIRYWKREEFRCRCGGKYCDGFPVEPNQTLVELADDLRAALGRPAHASSGLRCPVWNSIQGGVLNSRHMEGKALDFCVEGISGSELLSLARDDPRTRYAYLIDSGWVHIDVM